MFNTGLIDLATHQAWFARKLVDPDAFLFVIEAPLGMVSHEPVGYMRIEVEGVSGETSVAVLPGFRNRGYAAWAINEACARVFAERPDVSLMYAHIKTNNAASLRAFTKAGFLDRGVVNYEGHECVEMVFSRDNLVFVSSIA